MIMAKEKRGLTNEILFLVIIEGFLLYGVAMELIEYPGWLYTYPYLFLMLLAGICICIQGNSIKEWAFVLCMGVIALFSYMGSHDRSALVIALVICCTKNVRLEKLVKLDFAVRLLSGIPYIVLPFIGMIPNHIKVMVGGRPRTFFGWYHPNGMGKSMMLICMEWCYLRHGRFRWYDYAGMAGLVAFLDVTANSRTSELLILGLLFWEAFSTALRKYNKDTCAVWTFLTSAALGGAVALPVFAVLFFEKFSNVILERMGTVGSRLHLTWSFVQVHGITLFGSSYTPGSDEYLDMLFANAVFRQGYVFGLILIGLSILAVWYAYRKRDERYLLLLFVFFAYGMMESEHLNPIYAFFPLLLGIPVFDQKDEERVQEAGKG